MRRKCLVQLVMRGRERAVEGITSGGQVSPDP